MSEKLNRALRTMMRDRAVPVFTGVVKAVNGSTCDVQPNDGGALIYDVRLKVAVNTDDIGTWAVPKVGSQVLVAMLDGNINSLIVIQVETASEFIIRVDGNAEMRLKANGALSINGEQYGGLVKVQELRQELAKVNAFLTTLRAAIQAAPVSPGDGGASFKAALSAAIGGSQLPTYSNIESTTTKHGSL